MTKYPELVVYALDGGSQRYILEQAAAGNLPGFKRALENGTALNDCRPPFPSITPTCWASFSTGTTPDVHGITDQDILFPGMPPDQLGTGYSGHNLLAERFWEAAAKIGKKSLILNLPTSGPNIAPGVRCFCTTNRCDPDQRTIPVPEDISDQLYVFNGDAVDFFPSDDGIPTPSGQWQPQITLKPSAFHAGKDGCVILEVEAKNDRENPSHIEPFNWVLKRQEDGGIFIAFTQEALKAGDGFSLTPGKWSDSVRRSLRNDYGVSDYVFRFKMIPGGAPGAFAGGAFAVYITSAVDLKAVAAPPAFAGRLSGMKNIPPDNLYGRFLVREGCLDTALECTAFDFGWHREVISDAAENEPFDILITYQPQLDSVNHMYRSVFEGVATASDAEKATAAEAFERTYKQADEFLCWLYDHVIGPDTLLLIVSDHGAVGYNRILNPLDALEKAGLAVRSDKTDPWGLPLADIERSRAIPVGCGNVYVNLKGRFPCGIVEPADYDRTIEEIIAALQMHYGGALAFAVENKQAGFIGQGGPRSGDVIFGISGGTAGGFIGGVHACQMPTAKSKTGSINALCILSGNAFVQNTVLARPANLFDLAPTLCHVLGYPQPAQATGAILFQAINRKTD